MGKHFLNTYIESLCYIISRQNTQIYERIEKEFTGKQFLGQKRQRVYA